jgi:tetratricopeptide (TPR) repeat protein
MIRKGVPGPWLFVVLCLAPPCFCQSAPNPQQQIEAHLQQAHRLLSENQPAAAIPEFQAVIALDPANIDARGNLGVLQFFAGDYKAAVPNLRETLRAKPDLWKIQALLGMGERRTGDMEAARADLEKSFPALQDKKVRVEAGLELIEIYTAGDDLDKASGIVSTLRAIDPENPEVLYVAYRVHSDLARESILSLSLVAPKSALLYQAAAHEAARRGDTAGAIRDDREALKLDPTLPGLHFELAEMLGTLPATSANTAEVKAEYEAALAQNPFDEKAMLRLADIALRNNDQKKAYEAGSRALQLQPDDPEANYELAKILLNMNEPEKAEPLLQHAEEEDSTNAVIHYRLSTVYHRLGRPADAEREVEQYKKYKDLKEQLRNTWKDLHFNPEKPDMYGQDAQQK